MSSISASKDLGFSQARKLFIPTKKNKKTRTTSRFRFEDTIPTSNFKIAMSRIEGNNTAYYFELAGNECTCRLCKLLWPDELKYSEKGRTDLSYD